MLDEFKKILGLFIKNNKSKYVDLLYRIIKNDLECFYSEDKEIFFNHLSDEDLNDINPTHLILFCEFFKYRYGWEQFNILNEFIENNEKNRIKDNDISKYKTFEQINKANYTATLNLESKEMEKQVIKVYEDENYLLIRPLTYFSNLKYGRTTKWCTASEKSPEYFWKYASNGVLIYVIDKRNDNKYAVFKALNYNEVSFWDVEDVRIDSYQMKIDGDIKEIVFRVIDLEQRANRSYLSEEDAIKEKEIISFKQPLGYIPDYIPVGGYIGTSTISFRDTVNNDEVFDIIEERNRLRNQERRKRSETLSATFDVGDNVIVRSEYDQHHIIMENNPRRTE